MKILRIKFYGLKIFKNPISVYFTAKDKVFDDGNCFKLHDKISTLNSMAFIGMNAVGKTTILRLIKFQLDSILKNEGLNGTFNSVASYFKQPDKDGIKIVSTFYDNDKIFELESIINYKIDEAGRIQFYYAYEKIKVKNKSSVKNKDDVFNFDNVAYNTKDRTYFKNLYAFLKEDESISMFFSKENRYVEEIFNGFGERMIDISKSIHPDILKVFDKTLESIDLTDDKIKLKFIDDELNLSRESVLILDRILSSGTIKGQDIIKKAIAVLKTGGYLIIDELEDNLNKSLVDMIINLFKNDVINKFGATIIFSTHYAEILDGFNRKDNIFVMTKNKENKTRISRFSDHININNIKKSDIILSDYITGTMPDAVAIQNLNNYIKRIVNEWI